MVLQLLLILHGRVERPVVLLPHLEKHRLAVVAQVVIALVGRVVQMGLAHVGLVTVAQRVQVRLQLLVIVPFMPVTAEAGPILMAVEAAAERMPLEAPELLVAVGLADIVSDGLTILMRPTPMLSELAVRAAQQERTRVDRAVLEL